MHTLARRLRLRRAAELGGDWLRFQVDYRTAPRYQPLPWRDPRRESAGRTEGVLSRWEAMRPLLLEHGPETALDVGCNIGWFTLRLASLGVEAVGVESFPPYYRTALYATKRAHADGVAILPLGLNARSVRLLPAVDCTLFLAVWHHLVQQAGEDEATAVLEEMWARTGRILFFESGEEEMGPEFGLPPLEPDARTWFTDYLQRTCAGATVHHLGLHHGGNGGSDAVWRNLFALVRTSE